jgi:hypothetical protein
VVTRLAPTLGPDPCDPVLVKDGIRAQKNFASREGRSDDDSVERISVVLRQQRHLMNGSNSDRNDLNIQIVRLLLKPKDISLQWEFADAVFYAYFPERRDADPDIVVRIRNNGPNFKRQQFVICPKPQEGMRVD